MYHIYVQDPLAEAYSPLSSARHFGNHCEIGAAASKQKTSPVTVPLEDGAILIPFGTCQTFKDWIDCMMHEYLDERCKHDFGVSLKDCKDVLRPKISITRVMLVGDIIKFSTDDPNVNVELDCWFNIIAEMCKSSSTSNVTCTAEVEVNICRLEVSKPVLSTPQFPMESDMWYVIAAVRNILVKCPMDPTWSYADAYQHLRKVVEAALPSEIT